MVLGRSSALVIGALALSTAGVLAQDAVEIGTWPVGIVGNVECQGSLLFWSSGAQLRISQRNPDPSHPLILSTLSMPGNIRRIRVDANTVYTAMDYGGVGIVDISDPAAPTLRSVWQSGTWIGAVCPDGALLYAVGLSSDFFVLDVSSPDHPELLGSTQLEAYMVDLVVQGDRVFVAHGDGLSVVDVSQPDVPVLVAAHESIYCYRMRFLHENALVTNDGGRIRIWDVTNPLSLTQLGVIGPLGDSTAPGLDISGNWCATSLSGDGADIIDLSDVYHPITLGHYASDTFGGLRGCALEGSSLYLATGEGVKSLALDESGSPTLTDYQQMPSSTRHAAVDGNLAVIASYWNSMSLVDHSDAAHPAPLCVLHRTDNPVVVALARPFAYLGTMSKLIVFDVTSPSEPNELGSLAITRYFQDLEYRDGFLYAASWDGGLTVFNVTNPLTPVVSNENPVFSGEGVCVTAQHIYVGAGEDGIRIYRRTNPGQPVYCGTWSDGVSDVQDLLVVGEVLYAAGLVRLLVLDCQDPCHLSLITSIPGAASGVAVAGERLVVSGTSSDPRIFDISISGAPVQVGVYGNRGNTSHVFSDGQYVYHIGAEDAFSILDAGGSVTVAIREGQDLLQVISIDRVYPNPFNPVVTIEYSLTHTEQVDLAICDLAGRRVRVLRSETAAAGRYTEQWDGRDSAGMPCSSGRYLVRLATPSNLRTEAVVLVR